MKEANIKIQGMSCMHCVARVEKALNSVEGVKSASVSLEDEQADVEYDETIVQIKKIKGGIEEAGYGIKE